MGLNDSGIIPQQRFERIDPTRFLPLSSSTQSDRISLEAAYFNQVRVMPDHSVIGNLEVRVDHMRTVMNELRVSLEAKLITEPVQGACPHCGEQVGSAVYPQLPLHCEGAGPWFYFSTPNSDVIVPQRPSGVSEAARVEQRGGHGRGA